MILGPIAGNNFTSSISFINVAVCITSIHSIQLLSLLLLLKIRFFEILNGVVELNNDKNIFYLTEEKYNVFLSEIKEAKYVNVKKNQFTIGDLNGLISLILLVKKNCSDE